MIRTSSSRSFGASRARGRQLCAPDQLRQESGAVRGATPPARGFPPWRRTHRALPPVAGAGVATDDLACRYPLSVLRCGHEIDQSPELFFRALHAHAHGWHALVAVDAVVQQGVDALRQAWRPGSGIAGQRRAGGGIGVTELATGGIHLRQRRVRRTRWESAARAGGSVDSPQATSIRPRASSNPGRQRRELPGPGRSVDDMVFLSRCARRAFSSNNTKAATPRG